MKKGFVYDMARCIGCRACQIACKEVNQLPVGVFFRRVADCELASGEKFFYSAACNHCEEPACVAVCPVGAMYLAEDRTVRHDDALCMGCERCVFACPYGAVAINPASGYSAKCNSCATLRERGEEPACVRVCPTGALGVGLVDEELENDICEKYTYGGPAVLAAPDKTLPTILVKNVPESQKRARGEAESRFLTACEGSELYVGGGAPEGGASASVVSASGEVDVLVVGGGIAAVRAAFTVAEMCEKLGKNPRPGILICSDEKVEPYTRPLLTKGLLRGFSLLRYSAFDAGAAARANIEFRTGTSVEKLDAATHRAWLADGTSIGYNVCILATGAEAFVPPIRGLEEIEYEKLRKVGDTERIRRRCVKGRSAAVIGGGFIGLEAAWQLKELGLDVTVLEGAPKLLGRLVDASTSEVLKEKLAAAGLPAYTGVGIDCFRKDGEKSVVCLADGREFSVDFVLMSTGVRANAKLAEEAGAAATRNIKVNTAYETSLADVYACGDCCEIEPGTPPQTWTGAVLSGRACGLSVALKLMGLKAGDVPVAEDNATSMMVNAGDIHVLSCGNIIEGEGADNVVLTWTDEPALRVNENLAGPGGDLSTRGVFFFRGGKLAGACAIGSMLQLQFIQDAVNAAKDKEIFLKEAEERKMFR